MELHHITKLVIFIGGGFLFNFLFWDEMIGVNLLLFSGLIVGLGILTRPEIIKSRGVLVCLGGIALTGIMVLFHHSFVSGFVHLLSIFVFLGLLCEPDIRAVYHALAANLLNAFDLPKSIAYELFHGHKNYDKLRKRLRLIKLIVIPIGIFWIFYLIFYASNPVFKKYSDAIWNSIGEVLTSIFEDLSFPWLASLLFGMVITGLIVFRSKRNSVAIYEDRLSDDIQRKRVKREHIYTFRTPNMISLKNEYKSALFLTASINALLLIVNVIDINWIWFNFEYDGIMNLSQLVHEGTYLLILSILLSMGILLYFFRKNINFLHNNIWLRRFANIWILQNTILVISVVVRNYHYMHHFGLAYKRIGVIFFLTAVIVGLITLYIKINKAKTTFYLLRVNSWAVYGLLLILSSVNWDVVIVKHNIKYTSERNMDVEFLLSLSDKTLPILHENQDKLNLNGYNAYSSSSNVMYLDRRIRAFKKDKKHFSWKSWNYQDAKAFAYFDSVDD